MKTALLYKTVITFLLIPAFVFANGGKWSGKHTKEKKLHKGIGTSNNKAKSKHTK